MNPSRPFILRARGRTTRSRPGTGPGGLPFALGSGTGALPSELLERRPDIAAAERRVAVANAQVGVATAGFFPRLLLSAGAGWQGSGLAGLFSVSSQVWSLGATLAETLFDAGKRRANVDQARAAYDASVAVYRQTVLTSFQRVEDDLATLRLLAVESRQQAAATAAAARALVLPRNRYLGGVTTFLEVVTAAGAALSNERAAVQLQVRRMTATVDLMHAFGGGWEEAAPAPASPVVDSGRPWNGFRAVPEL
jgi:NodT family efflux transporter outer membrane factor (OMF) lipoprotein